MTKGLKLTQINDYIDWCYYLKRIKQLQVKLKTKKYDGEKDKERTQKEIEDINKAIGQYTKDDTDIFKNVNGWRVSSRVQSNKNKADANERNEMEKDAQFLQNFEKWIGEKNVNPEILQHRDRM